MDECTESQSILPRGGEVADVDSLVPSALVLAPLQETPQLVHHVDLAWCGGSSGVAVVWRGVMVRW